MSRYLPVALTALLLFSFACNPFSDDKSDAETAADALSRGLDAQVAGDLDEAEEAYREVLRLEPQNQFAFYNLGLVYQTRGNLAEAETNYRSALAISPDYPPALFNLAIVRNDLGDVDGAIELYRHVISVDPNNASAHLNLGFALLATGEEQEAEDEFDIAVELDPSLESRITDSSTPEPNEPETSGTSTPEP